MYSNFTPRSNKYAYPGAKEVVVFGIQYLIKEYLIKLWNENFFQRNREEVIDEYKTLMDSERSIIKLAGEAEDEVTVALLTDYLKEQEKLTWMLVALLTR